MRGRCHARPTATALSLATAVLVALSITLLVPRPVGATTNPPTSEASAATPHPASTSTPPPASVTTPIDLGGTPDPAVGADPEGSADVLIPTEGPSTTGTPIPTPLEPPVPPPAPPPATSRAAREIIEEIEGRAERRPDLLGTLLDSDGDHPPWGNYDLGASVGAISSLFSHQARLVFSAGMWAVGVSDWLLGFVMRFDVGRVLSRDTQPIVERYAGMLDGDGTGSIPLKELMLLLAVAHAGWQVFRHRAAAAVPELLVAATIAATGTFLLTHVDDAACTGLNVMADLTVGTMALASPDPPEGAAVPARADLCGEGSTTQTTSGGRQTAPSVVRQTAPSGVRQTMVTTFLHEPFLLLQWGELPEVGSDCRDVAEALIRARSWADDDFPRDRMTDAGCEDMATFNAALSIDRVMGASAYALGAAAFAVAIVLTAGTLLVAQVAGILLVMVMPFAVVVGISPGAGRELLARWGHNVLKVAVLFLGSGFFLALMTSAVSAVQAGTAQQSVLLRMLSSVLVAWTLVLLRGRVFANLRLAGRGLSARVAGPGVDVGGVGSGPAQRMGRGAYTAADVALTMHGGAQAVRALGSMGAAGGPTTAMVAGRGRALGRHHRAVQAATHPPATGTSATGTSPGGTP